MNFTRTYYQKIQKSIKPESEHIVTCSQENNQLKNRYMLVNAPDDLSTPTSTPTSRTTRDKNICC